MKSRLGPRWIEDRVLMLVEKLNKAKPSWCSMTILLLVHLKYDGC